ncbi:MAG: nucleotidyltransferase family protein [Bacteroidales bacterium]|nr:nucleotidyltransferase family protein [Bacteroidales bacterium]
MERSIPEILFRLLRLSTGQKDEDFPMLSSEEWRAVYDLALHQSLLGIAFSGIEHLPNEKWPEKLISMKFYAQVKYIRSFTQRATETSIEVVDRFARQGRRSVILKGVTSGALYDDPSLRSSGDVDIWVESDRKWLKDFVRSINPNAGVYYHHITLIKIRGVELEAHFMPTWMNNPFVNARLQRWFAGFWQDETNIQEVKVSGGSVPGLSDRYNRVFLLIHIFRHLFMDGVGMRQIMDYYCLLRKGLTPEEREETMVMLRSFRLDKFAAAVMYLLGECFHLPEEKMLCAPDGKRGRFLLSEVMRSGNFGNSDSRIKGDANASSAYNFFTRIIRSLRFLPQYPSEAL